MPKNKDPLSRSKKSAKIKNVEKQKSSKEGQGKFMHLQKAALPSGWVLIKNSAIFLWLNKKLFSGILAIYGLLQLIFIQGVIRTDFNEINQTAQKLLGEQWSGLASGLTMFTYLLGSSNQNVSPGSSGYQTIFLILGSLAFIWALRQVSAGKSIRIRDAYYKGMYPLIPFTIVLVILTLQLIPAAIGAWLFTNVTVSGIAATNIELLFWFLVLVVLSALSIYMICATLIALYIATLPDMTPIKAVRTANDLVRGYRISIVKKLLFLAIAILLSMMAILLPIILFIPLAVPVIFFVVTVLLIGLIHTYMYNLYRELLNNG